MRWCLQNNDFEIAAIDNIPGIHPRLVRVNKDQQLRQIELRIGVFVQFSQPKLQKPVHQQPRTTSHAVIPPSGASFPHDFGAGAFSVSVSGEV